MCYLSWKTHTIPIDASIIVPVVSYNIAVTISISTVGIFIVFAIPISIVGVAIVISIVIADVSVAVSSSILVTVIPSIKTRRIFIIFQFESQILSIQIPFQYRCVNRRLN